MEPKIGQLFILRTRTSLGAFYYHYVNASACAYKVVKTAPNTANCGPTS